MLDDITIEAAELEVVGGGFDVHFDVRGANDPASLEFSLTSFEGGTVTVEKNVASGKIILHVRSADAASGDVPW